MKDMIKSRKSIKACPVRDTCETMKMNKDIFSRLIFQSLNQSFVDGEFLYFLKQVEVIPVFKKRNNFSNSIKELYFTSNLQNVLKVDV